MNVRFPACPLPPGRGFNIKSMTSFQSFFKIALAQTKKGNTLAYCPTDLQWHGSVTITFMTSPANMLRGDSCGAKALHAIVVDEACLFEGFQGLIDLLICP